MRILWLLAILASTLLAETGLVRSVQFQKFQGVTAREIVQRLHDRDIELVERPYDPQNVATAQQIVEELLAEKGHREAVRVTITELRGGAVKITFAPMK
jgi:hypothetical protein